MYIGQRQPVNHSWNCHGSCCWSPVLNCDQSSIYPRGTSLGNCTKLINPSVNMTAMGEVMTVVHHWMWNQDFNKGTHIHGVITFLEVTTLDNHNGEKYFYIVSCSSHFSVTLVCAYCKFILTQFKAHSHQTKVKAKAAKYFFDVRRFFFNLFASIFARCG